MAKIKQVMSGAMLALIAAGAAAPVMLDQFLDEKEGNTLTAVVDPGGVWSICRGVTRIDGRAVKKGDRVSPLKCNELNAVERNRALAWVSKNVHVPLTEFQKVGIASFCPYNIGPSKCLPSTFYSRLNSGDTAGACEALRWWIRDGGKDCRIRSNNCYGQVIRREQESALVCWGLDGGR